MEYLFCVLLILFALLHKSMIRMIPYTQRILISHSKCYNLACNCAWYWNNRLLFFPSGGEAYGGIIKTIKTCWRKNHKGNVLFSITTPYIRSFFFFFIHRSIHSFIHSYIHSFIKSAINESRSHKKENRQMICMHSFRITKS